MLAFALFGPWLRATTETFGAVAQLGERLNGIQEVRGSIPLGSTKSILNHPPTREGVLLSAHHRLSSGRTSVADAMIGGQVPASGLLVRNGGDQNARQEERTH